MTYLLKRRLLKAILHLFFFGWISVTFYLAVTDQLGADPVEELIHFTGTGALNLLLFTLSLSFLSKKFKTPLFLQLRRMTGLYAFFYACCHLLSFLFFEVLFDLKLFISEVVKRPYITLGMAAFVLLTMLALTSPDAIKKRMGKSWQRLHNWVYLALILVIVHYLWSLKLITLTPIIYLFLITLICWLKKDKIFKYIKKPG